MGTSLGDGVEFASSIQEHRRVSDERRQMGPLDKVQHGKWASRCGLSFAEPPHCMHGKGMVVWPRRYSTVRTSFATLPPSPLSRYGLAWRSRGDRVAAVRQIRRGGRG